jgi:hypothetical protein
MDFEENYCSRRQYFSEFSCSSELPVFVDVGAGGNSIAHGQKLAGRQSINLCKAVPQEYKNELFYSKT